MASYIRLDKGTETGTMATMHAFLRHNDEDTDACDTVLYGPSTSNQVRQLIYVYRLKMLVKIRHPLLVIPFYTQLHYINELVLHLRFLGVEEKGFK